MERRAQSIPIAELAEMVIANRRAKDRRLSDVRDLETRLRRFITTFGDHSRHSEALLFLYRTRQFCLCRGFHLSRLHDGLTRLYESHRDTQRKFLGYFAEHWANGHRPNFCRIDQLNL